MRVILDIEANSLVNPTHIWVIVCKDIDTGELNVFRNICDDKEERRRLGEFWNKLTRYIGHNFLEYDYPIIHSLTGLCIQDVDNVSDTLILSRLIDYSRKSHSIRSYGEEFGTPKIDFNDYKKWSQELEDYCIRDVDICEKIYKKYLKYINNPNHSSAISLEHHFQLVCNSLHNSGFAFNRDKASKLLSNIEVELNNLDKEIQDVFPPRLHPVREIQPRYTKHGTLNRGDFRWMDSNDLSEFNGGPFTRCVWKRFNPDSHKQVVDILRSAKWVPTDKTQTHIETERTIQRLKYNKNKVDEELQECYTSLKTLEKYGWKINENNLSTLPASAPPPARTLARRILIEARRRTLTEWLGLCSSEERIHGKFQGIGAWTHRMAHQNPNMANIPNEYKENGDKKLLGKEFRSLWIAPKKRLLVGVDAEGIQLRIFAHMINDQEFTDAIVRGSKTAKTDPHSLNRRILGDVCKTRQAAKRFIYALLLGAGTQKLASVLECSISESKEALDRILRHYTGWQTLKENVFPNDARRGYFHGLDGRKVAIPGESISQRKHLCMSGYLQNGEAVCMKLATMKWFSSLSEYDARLVNFVHDEWQIECPNNMKIATEIGEMLCKSLETVGQELKLNCPLAGSFWNDTARDYTIGTNWSVTH